MPASQWKPIETAPKDGTVIRARGWNWGDRLQGRHTVKAMWHNGEWVAPRDYDEFFRYLTDWKPESKSGEQ